MTQKEQAAKFAARVRRAYRRNPDIVPRRSCYIGDKSQGKIPCCGVGALLYDRGFRRSQLLNMNVSQLAAEAKISTIQMLDFVAGFDHGDIVVRPSGVQKSRKAFRLAGARVARGLL